MKKLLTTLCTLTLAIGLAVAADTSAKSPAPAPTTASAPAAGSEAVSVPDRPCNQVNLLDSPEAIAAGGFKVDTKANTTLDIPNCPSVYTNCTSHLHVYCNATGCTDSDTGSSSCRLPNGHTLSCGEGTVHVITCSGCEEEAEDACCSAHPGCLCAPCGTAGNQTIYCSGPE